MCVGFQRILDSDYALQRPDLAMWYCLIRSYSHTDATSSQYANAVNRFAKWLQETFNQSLDDVGLPFSEKSLIFYFCYSGCYRKGKYDRGVLLSTMKKDLTAFRRYCKARKRPIPMFEYTELELLLLGYKTFQRFRIAFIRHPISRRQMERFLKALLRSGTFIDLVWALALSIAWCAALRTGEWTIRDGRAIHKPETLYWDNCSRDSSNRDLLYISVPTMKNWRKGVDICFDRNFQSSVY